MKIHHLIILVGCALLLLCASQIRPLFEPEQNEPQLTREFEILQERLNASGIQWPPELFHYRTHAAIDAARELEEAQMKKDRRTKSYFYTMLLTGVVIIALGLGQRSVDLALKV